MANAALTPRWSPPDLFDEYRLVRLLGRGAMGLVYLAHDGLLDRSVAIKFIASVRPDETARQRFYVEARAIARLSHPNVVAVHRVGEVDGRPYLVAEFVRGRSLDEIERPIPWKRALTIGLGLARGLAAAHRQGVLHRDIKPANVMLTEADEVKLLDFGLAKLLAEGTAAAAEPGALAPSDEELRGRSASMTRELTGVGDVVGTPLYMAPETLRAEPATRRSDIYSLGAVVYALCAGTSPRESSADADWIHAEPAPLASLTHGIEPRFAAAVSRCLQQDPSLRFASADELCDALTLILQDRDAGDVPRGNPYRGLSPFEAEHRSLFFGRSVEIEAVLDRLRAQTLVLIAGDSGVGKSSLCRAGVLPRVAEGALGDGRRISVISVIPGKHPLDALAQAAPVAAALRVGPAGPAGPGGAELDVDRAELVHAMRADPGRLGRELARTLGRSDGLVLFVDQLEELLTLSDAEEAACFAQVITRLGSLTSAVRVLMTVRGDFFTRIAALPGFAEEASRALYLLRPLSPAATRIAITGPAHRTGVTFESDEMISALVESSTRAPGGLPLLQFALAELWEARDPVHQRVTAAALEEIGGVVGALARHADGVIAALPHDQRRSARRILLRLITAEGTRARRSAEELDGGAPTARATLEALVRSRLLVAREMDDQIVYEVAHEALLKGWETLRGWLDTDGEQRRAHARVEAAAAEWLRLGRAPDALWSERRLAAAAALDAGELSPLEAEFLAASRRALRRARLHRWAGLAVTPVLLLIALGGVRLKARHDLERVIDRHEAQGRAATASGTQRVREAEEQRRLAFERFDTLAGAPAGQAAARREEAEQRWARAREAYQGAEAAFATASQAFEAGLALEPASTKLRGLIGDVCLERILVAEGLNDGERRRDLAQRLALYDEGGERRRWLDAPPRLSIESAPAGAEVTLERYADDGGHRRPVRVGVVGRTPVVEAEIAAGPGSYRLQIEAPGREVVRFPVQLARAERARVAVALPAAGAVPRGYVHVPAGRFLFGSSAIEGLRRGMLNAQPLREVQTGSYVIKRTEVTLGDWIEFLRELPPSERDRRLPHTNNRQWGVELGLTSGDAWQLALVLNGERTTVREGQPLVIPARDRRVAQDWRRFPVTGIAMSDAHAYMDWLGRTGRLPGARFCDEREWERAGRGADDRSYPHGDRLDPDDANFDETYGRVSRAFGPDEAGSHPASESPFGLHDMSGSVYEWTRSAGGEGEIVVRSGAWYYDRIAVRIENRTLVEPETRDYALGFRVCADFTPRE
ncbi:nSTAND1 domain-containing NTPase [Sorangium sp. So ce1153]|uniref:nSTAND1 domain-containing NTPase n=1 Tax=Sorangium sp. So ce1153 TaxID=3133333 RepID=UPI003F61C6E2